MGDETQHRLSSDAYIDIVGDLGDRLAQFPEIERELADAEEARKTAHNRADAAYEEIHGRWVKLTRGIANDKDMLASFLPGEPDIDGRRKAILSTALDGAREHQANPFERAQQLTEDIERLEPYLAPGTPILSVVGQRFTFGSSKGEGIVTDIKEGYRGFSARFFIDADNSYAADWSDRYGFESLDNLIVESQSLNIEPYEIAGAIVEPDQVPSVEEIIETGRKEYRMIIIGTGPIGRYVELLSAAEHSQMSQTFKEKLLFGLYTAGKLSGIDVSEYAPELTMSVPEWKERVEQHVTTGIGAAFKKSVGMYCDWEEDRALDRGYDKFRAVVAAFDIGEEDIVSNSRERVMAEINKLYKSEVAQRTRQAEILIPALVKSLVEFPDT